MFAVKGWSVSETKPKAETAAQAPRTAGQDASVGQGKKRKRRPGRFEVTKDNVAEAWERFVERPSGSHKQVGDKPRKKQKHGHETKPKSDKNTDSPDAVVVDPAKVEDGHK